MKRECGDICGGAAAAIGNTYTFGGGSEDGNFSSSAIELADVIPVCLRIIGEPYFGLGVSMDGANQVLHSKTDMLVVGNKSL